MRARTYELTVFESRENLSGLRSTVPVPAPFRFVHASPTVENVRRIVHDLLPLATIDEQDMTLYKQVHDGDGSMFSVSVRMESSVPDFHTAFSVSFMEV